MNLHEQYNMSYDISIFAKYHEDFRDLSNMALDSAIEMAIDIIHHTSDEYVYHLIKQHEKSFIIKNSRKSGNIIYYKMQVSLSFYNAFADKYPADIINTGDNTSRTKEYSAIKITSKLEKISRKAYLDEILNEM